MAHMICFFATFGTLISGLNTSIKNNQEIKPFFLQFRYYFSKGRYLAMLVGQRLNACTIVLLDYCQAIAFQIHISRYHLAPVY